MTETAEVAKLTDGDSLYQQRARAALPILVRQAHATKTIYYADLASELGMSNPRTLNYPLGSIGQTLISLSKDWGHEIPPIQCIVVNQADEMPGEGFGWFVKDKDEFRNLPKRQRRAITDAMLAKVFAYPRWNEVLAALELKPLPNNYKDDNDAAAKYRGGGETELHKKLKQYVADNPQIVGLSNRAKPGKQEFDLPSGDSVDVYFHHAAMRTAVEVKSRISPRADIIRGLYQCVKYRAVLKARIDVEISNDGADAILVLEGTLPDDLHAMRNTLQVTVFENVIPT